MIIFPAIDIKDKKCVRLTQGDFDKVNVYGEDPSLMAKKWADYGAEFIHVVNLNGSRDEVGINDETLEKIATSVDIPIQVGGGIRDEKRVKELLDLGINRVIVGTMAIENKNLLKELINKYGQEKIVVSIDARNKKVATHGWEKLSDIDSVDLCKELEQIGVKTIVYTDISKDGMLKGPNFDIYKELSQKTSLDIIASGGVTSIDDIKKLRDMNMYGAIIGKALYDKKLDLKEVIDLC